ncbi:PAS domain-containing protein, partial [Halobacterium salinarum]|nr:PAS domain-containing protein [Halobacterium salinarum]
MGEEVWRGALSQFFTAFPEPLFVVDRDGTVVLWNDAIVEMTGVEAADAVGTPSIELFGTEGETQTLAEAVLERGEAIRETSVRTSELPAGAQHAKASATPLHNDGAVIGAVEVLTIVTDVVEQRERVTRAQRTLTDDVEAAVTELRDAGEGVADASQEISDLAAEQASDVNDIAADVSDLSATIQEVAASADEVRQRSTEARERAEASREAAERVLAAVEAFA